MISNIILYQKSNIWIEFLYELHHSSSFIFFLLIWYWRKSEAKFLFAISKVRDHVMQSPIYNDYLHFLNTGLTRANRIQEKPLDFSPSHYVFRMLIDKPPRDVGVLKTLLTFETKLQLAQLPLWMCYEVEGPIQELELFPFPEVNSSIEENNWIKLWILVEWGEYNILNEFGHLKPQYCYIYVS